ncbi:hypothetical protein [Hyphomonas sp. CY54-11-8]|uniref:hypothetical protein n=1 Tax=Hyphomonas sp. CY54-11-8 TaxID=1280944 RepID=UPI0018CC323E|nr:hypothetical protein [Hyphomonas sp. CY54-11-8]
MDSVSGSDSNDGTSLAGAFQTLGAVETAALAFGDNVRIALVAGSEWREPLELSSLSGVSVTGIGALPANGLPIVRGDDVVTGWTAHATLSNVWEKTGWTHDASGTERLIMFKDDALMTRIADAASLTADGQFVTAVGSDGSPWTLQIYSTTDPNSDGSVYEAGKRRRGIFLGNSGTVSLLETARTLANNGSFDTLNKTGASVSRMVSADGGKHNHSIGSGEVTDIVTFRSDPPTVSEPANTLFVAYVDNPTSLSVAYTRCFAADTAPVNGVTGFYSHGASSPSDYFASLTMDQCGASGVKSGFSGLSLARTLTNIYTRKTPQPVAGNDGTLIVRRGIFDMSNPGNGLFDKIVFTKLTAAGSLSVTFVDCIFYSADASGVEMIRFNTVGAFTFTNCIFYSGSANRPKMIQLAGWAGSTMNVNGCIFYGPGSYMLDIPSTVTYVGNNNVFYNPTGNVNLRFNSTNYTDIASWRTATGQDASSVIANPDFSGTVANGDFRLTASGGADAIGAGVQNHWGWNTRAIVSGPPSVWPVIPESQADARDYCLDPEAWDFST